MRKKNLLKTRRLKMRTLTLDDYPLWKEAFSNQLTPQNEFDRGNLSEKQLTRASFKKRMKLEAENKKNEIAEVLYVFDIKLGKIIGRSGFEIQRGSFQSVHLGYSIFNSYWGQGYGEESVRAIIIYIFKVLKIHRIEVSIEAKNKRSIRLAKTLGFAKEGVKRKLLFRDSQWRDLISFSLICDDYKIKWKEGQ